VPQARLPSASRRTPVETANTTGLRKAKELPRQPKQLACGGCCGAPGRNSRSRRKRWSSGLCGCCLAPNCTKAGTGDRDQPGIVNLGLWAAPGGRETFQTKARRHLERSRRLNPRVLHRAPAFSAAAATRAARAQLEQTHRAEHPNTAFDVPSESRREPTLCQKHPKGALPSEAALANDSPALPHLNFEKLFPNPAPNLQRHTEGTSTPKNSENGRGHTIFGVSRSWGAGSNALGWKATKHCSISGFQPFLYPCNREQRRPNGPDENCKFQDKRPDRWEKPRAARSPNHRENTYTSPRKGGPTN